MRLPRTVAFDRLRLQVIDRAEYAVAHPEETHLCVPGEHCLRCLLAARPDTGEFVLLWGAGCDHTRSWAVSRETPDYERHRRELGP